MADESASIGQNEIDELLKQAAAGAGTPKAPATQTPSAQTAEAALKAGVASSEPATTKPPSSGDKSLAQNDIEFLLNQAEQAIASVNAPAGQTPPGVKPFRLPDFASAAPTAEVATLDLIRDVELDLRIELGRTHMYLEDVLKLSKGSVVTLDKLAGDPVDIFVNGRLIARGEVLILNENFCVRVAELVVPETSTPAV
jgi:flagellar motor switch protein FliN